MTIRDLVERLEKIEQKAGDNTREELSILIDDIIEFDIRMSKMLGTRQMTELLLATTSGIMMLMAI